MKIDPADPFASLSGAVPDLLAALWGFLPRLVAALVLLLIGWLLAAGLRIACRRLLNWLPTVLLRWPALSDLSWSTQAWPLPLLPGLIFWVVLLGFVTAATQLLGLGLFTQWMSSLLAQVPGLLGAVLVIIGGMVAAQLLRDMVNGAAASAGLQYPGVLGGAAQLSLLVLSAIIGLDLLGLDSTFLTVAAALSIGMLGGALALSFGLGARDQVSNLLGARDARMTYQPGQRIRIAEWEGVILDIGPRAILLDTEQGRVQVPGHIFATQPSILLVLDDD